MSKTFFKIMKFSITIPAYKQKFLYEAVESCLAQTYDDFELIIVDDASPEDLKSVVDRFQDPRIRYYRNEKNCGALDVVDNWNICLGYVTGDYVICMGDDDELLPNCLEEYSKLIDKYPGLGVYHAWTEMIDEKGNIVNIQESRPEFETVSTMMFCRFRYNRLQYIGDWLFNVKMLRENKGFYKLPYAWGSDDVSVYIAALEYGVANSQTPLFRYRVSSLTISKGGFDKEKIEVINNLENIFYSILDRESFATEFQKKINKLCRDIIPHYISDRRNLQLANLFRNKGRQTVLWWIINGKKMKFNKLQVLKAWLKSF